MATIVVELDVARLRQQIQQINKDLDGLGKGTGLDDLDDGFEKTGTSAQKTSGILTNIKGIIATIVTVGAVKKIIDYATSWQQVERAVGTVIPNITQANEVVDQLVDIANDAGVGVVQVAEAFKQYSVATKSLGLSTSETIVLVGGIVKALGTFAGSSEAAAAATTQLAQAFSKGKLDGDELKTVLEVFPKLSEALAEVLGEPVESLRQLGEEGRITGEVMVKAFALLREEVDATAERLGRSLPQAGAAFSNELIRLVGIVSQATGVTGGLTKLLDGLATAFGTLADNVAETGISFGPLADLIGGEILDGLKKLSGGLIDLKGPFEALDEFFFDLTKKAVEFGTGILGITTPFTSFGSQVKTTLNGIVEDFKQLDGVQQILATFGGLFETSGEIIAGFGEGVLETVSNVIDVISQLAAADSFVEAFLGLFEGNPLEAFGASILLSIANIIEGFTEFDGIKQIIDNFAGLFDDNPVAVFVDDVVASIGEVLTKFGELDAVEGIIATFNGLFTDNPLVDFAKEVAESIGDAVESIGELVDVGDAIEAFSDLFDKAVDAVEGFADAIRDAIQPVLEFGDTITNAFGKALESIKGLLDFLPDSVKSVIGLGEAAEEAGENLGALSEGADDAADSLGGLNEEGGELSDILGDSSGAAEETADNLQQLGFAASFAGGEVAAFAQTANESFEQLPDVIEDVANEIEVVFGERAPTIIEDFSGESGEKIGNFVDDVIQVLDGIGISLEDIFGKKAGGVIEAFRTFFKFNFDEIERIAEGVFNFFGLEFTGLGDAAISAVTGIINIFSGGSGLFESMTSITSLIPGISSGFGILGSTGISSFGGISAAASSFLAFLGPIGLAILGVVAVLGVLELAGVDVFGTISDVAEFAFDAVVSAAEFMVDALVGIVSVIGNIFSAAFSLISTVATVAFDVIKAAAGLLVEALTASVSLIVEVFSAAFSAIQTVVTAVFSAIQAAASVMLDVLSAIASTILSAFTAAFSAVLSIAQTVLTGIISAASAMLSALQGIISTLLSAFTSAFTAILSLVQSVMSGIISAASAMLSALQGIISTLLSAFTSAFSAILSTAQSVFSGIVSAASSAFSAIVSIAQSAVGAIGSALGSLVGIAASAFGGIVSAASSAFDSVISIANSAAGTVGGILGGITSSVGSVGSAIGGIAKSVGGGIKSVGKKIGKAFGFAEGAVIDGPTSLLGDGLAGGRFRRGTVLPEPTILGNLANVTPTSELGLAGEAGKEGLLPLAEGPAGLSVNAVGLGRKEVKVFIIEGVDRAETERMKRRITALDASVPSRATNAALDILAEIG